MKRYNAILIGLCIVVITALAVRAIDGIIPLPGGVIVEPAKPQKVFTHGFLTEFGWECLDGTNVTLHTVTVPRTTEGELADESQHRRRSYSLTWAQLQAVAEASNAVVAIIAAMPAVSNAVWQAQPGN